MALSIEDILSATANKKTTTVEVPRWGGEVYIREISAGEYDRCQMRYYDAAKGASNRGHIRAAYVAAFLSDADGNRLFGDERIEQVSQMDAASIEIIYEAGRKFNGLDEEEEKNAEGEEDTDSSTS